MQKMFEKYGKQARILVSLVTSLVPLAVVGGLLYAAFFVKASAVVSSVHPPAIERRDSFLGVAAPNETLLWAAGSNGKIVRSDDAGATWVAQKSSTTENLQGIAAWDAKRAVVVGGDGAVLRTEDGGQLWEAVQVPKSEVANKLLNVKTSSDGVAWAVGEMGAMLKTTDFGRTWERVLPEKDRAWNDVSLFGNVGIVVGEFGQLMKTADGGKTWHSVSSGVESSLMSVYLKDASNAVAVGLSGVIVTTSDGGDHWHLSERKTREHLNSVIWDGSRWVAVGDKGVIVMGGADGLAWTAGRVSEGNLGWNTQIVAAKSGATPNGYILAGASLASLRGEQFSVFGRGAD